MLKKHIKIASFLIILILPFFVLGMIQNNKKLHLLSRGNYFFSQTRENPDISKVVLTFPDGNSIHIQKSDNFWRIKEADDYFAAFTKINTLIQLIRNTTVYRTDVYNPEAEAKIFDNALKIESFDDKSRIVDSALIALRDNNKYYSARFTQKDDLIYQISGDFNLSSFYLDWIQMPLFTFNDNQIKSIHAPTFTVYKKFPSASFEMLNENRDVNSINAFIGNLLYLEAESIKHASNFNLNNYPKSKSYEISLFNGIIFKLNLYSDDESYWLSINLEGDMLISNSASTQIKENKILYEGWFFKIDNDKGHILFNFIL